MGPVLITGGDGFVGGHLRTQVADSVDAAVDVLDRAALAGSIREVAPQALVHLAALSSVADSWQDTSAWTVNVIGTVNVLDAVRAEAPRARVLFPSTGEVYGRAETIPTPETAPVVPISPYAATKAAAEIACLQAARQGLDVVVARAFNHEGPGRDERFAIGSWVRQIARLEEAGGGALEVGDLTTERDLTDVRDVCRAYTLLLDDAVEPGIYNVASGRPVAMSTVVQKLLALARAEITVEQRAERLRPVDIPRMAGDASKLRAATGWEPEVPLDRTLADALDTARAEVRVA